MNEVTARVGTPSAVPKRPTLYLVICHDGRGYWTVPGEGEP